MGSSDGFDRREIDPVIKARTRAIAAASQMAPAFAAIDSALNARANAMAEALGAIDSALNVQMYGQALDRPVPVLSMTISEKQHHNCAAADAEIFQLREQLRLLESQVRGHWLDDTDEYDLDIDSLPWATEEG